MNSSSQPKIGPRTKCDQVMYEAIAKAAEIIVRGRCQLSAEDSTTSNTGNNSHIKGRPSNNNNGSNGSNGNINQTRFNLDLPPIASVRSILQMWKTSLHVPLRLDVYYEYCTDPTNVNAAGVHVEKNTRKELLERWCIDYIPSYLLSSDPTTGQTSSSGGGGGSGDHGTRQSMQQHAAGGTDDTIAQLRQVVKRIVIQLRVLWSMTRMMPAYQLYDALLHQTMQEEEMSWGNTTTNTTTTTRMGGYHHGPYAVGGGYYHQHQQHHQQQQPSSLPLYQQNNAHSMQHHQRDLVGGKIHFSFYVSNHISNEHSLHGSTTTTTTTTTGTTPNSLIAASAFCQESLFSCTTNTPFQKYDLTPIPTPFGVLYMTGLYDDTLNVGQILAQRQRRLVEWGMNGLGGQLRRSMPMEVPMRGGREKEGDREEGGMRIRNQEDNTELENRVNQQQVGGARSFPHPVDVGGGGGGGNGGEYGRQLYLGRQMSMPSPKSISSSSYDRDPLGVSPRVVSEHFVRSVKDGLNRPKSAEPGEGKGGSGGGRQRDEVGIMDTRKKLSGLSLALMNEEMIKNGNGNGGEADVGSEATVAGTNHENVALIRQRMAFHHPPPSFEEPSGSPHSVSASPQQQRQQQQQPVSVYGYGYNNGNVIQPMNARRSSFGYDGMRANSPSPNMPIASTPPQPMFIGSLNHRTVVGGASKHSPVDPIVNVTCQEKSEREDEVPFRNPTSLQKPAIVDFGSSTVFEKVSVSGSNQLLMQVPAEASANNIPVPQYGKESLLPPVNALDALASSPFKLTSSQNLSVGVASHGPSHGASVGLSAFSSLVMGKGSAAYGRLDEGFPLALSSGGGGTGFASSLAANKTNSDRISRSMIRTNFEYDHVYDDMPFAVDMDFSTQSSVGSTPKVSRQNSGIEFGATSSSTNMSSQVVTSLAHKCSTAGKLKLFNRSSNYQGCGENSIIDRSFVEEQLNDFRSFGESITSSGFLSSEKQ